MELGMIGLGRMGANMSERIRGAGHTVVGFDPVAEGADVRSLTDLVAALSTPRAVWAMVPAGPATESTVVALADLLSAGDIVVDGGNSNFHDSLRRGALLAEKGIGYIDAGVSGGIWGLKEGYALMVGGSDEDVARLMPIFDALRPEGGGFAHVGALGAGHFTKMVHNGIEYGIMQAFGEGYEVMKASPLGIDVNAALQCWQQGSVVRSWLLDLLVLALKDDPELASIAGYADDSGEGRWTLEEAIATGVPAPVLSAALFARFASRQDESPAMKAVAALRHQFGGHPVKAAEEAPR